MKNFRTYREFDIEVNIENYQPFHKSCDGCSPDDPEEIEISAWMITSKGKKTFKIQLSNLEVEALGLKQEAIEEIKKDRLQARIDRILDERREVPDRLREALGSIMSCHAGRQL